MDGHGENANNDKNSVLKHKAFNVFLNSVIEHITVRLHSQYGLRVKVFLFYGQVKNNDNQPDKAIAMDATISKYLGISFQSLKFTQ